MAKADLTREDIEHLAKLANLELTDTEIEKFKTQLSQTLDYMENLHELDTKNVQPTNHTTNQKDVFFEDGTSSERTFTAEEALANAKNKKNNFFTVKKMM